MDPNETPAPESVVSDLGGPLSHKVQLFVLSVALLFSIIILGGHTYTRRKKIGKMNETDYTLLFLIGSMVFILLYGLCVGHYGVAFIFAIFGLHHMFTGVVRYVVLRGLEGRFLDPRRGHVFEHTMFISIGFLMVFSFTSRFWLNLGSNHGLDVNGALATFLAHGGWKTVSHLSFLLYPTIAVRNSKLEPREKLGVTAVFGVGIFAILADIIVVRCLTQILQIKDTSSTIEPTTTVAFMTLPAALLFGCWPQLSSYFDVKFPIPHGKDILHSRRTNYHP